MRQQYHFRKVGDDTLIWDVKKIINLSKNLEPKQISLDKIKEFKTEYWYELGDANPTCEGITNHAKLINQADLSYPIILCKNGEILDGMHRVCKAHLLDHKTILAVQFKESIKPDYINIDPCELSY
ncbi:hypothetical protein FLM55_09170 [Francisella sp. Scap27]|nr:hypothetical protein FLM55_09170 [Francisella sp. Scap27]